MILHLFKIISLKLIINNFLKDNKINVSYRYFISYHYFQPNFFVSYIVAKDHNFDIINYFANKDFCINKRNFLNISFILHNYIKNIYFVKYMHLNLNKFIKN